MHIEKTVRNDTNEVNSAN